MKLPGIDYTTGVRPLGREDPSMPVKLAAAEAQVVQHLAQTAGQIYSKVQEQKAINYWSSTERQLNELETEFKTKPAMSNQLLKEEFDTRVAKLKTQANEELSGAANKIWSGRFSKSVNDARFRITTANALNLAKQERVNTIESLTELAKGDLPAALQGLQDSPMFSEEEKKKIRKTLPLIYENAQIEQALISDDPAFIQDNITRLEKGQSVLQGTELRHSISWLKTAYKEATAGAIAKLAHDRERRESKLTRCVDHGNCGPAQITAAFEDKTISGLKQTELLRNWEKQKEDNASVADRSAMLSNSLENNIPFDLKDNNAIKAIEEAYDRMEAEAEQIEDPMIRTIARQELNNWGVNVAIKTNILPKQMAADLRTFAFAGSPARVAEQVNIYESLQVRARHALAGLSTDITAFYESSSAMYRGGIPIGEAIEIARKNIKLPPEAKQALRQEYYSVEEKPKERLIDAFADDDHFDIGFSPFDEPEPTPAQIGAYTALEFEYYQKMDGNMALAKKAALNHFKRIFSGSIFGNPDRDVTAMPFAPEQFSGLSSVELEDDLSGFAQQNNISEKVYVVPDARTSRERVKSYPVLFINELDLPQIAKDKSNIPLRWTPDVTKVRTKRLEKAMAKRTKREMAREAREEEAQAEGFVPSF